MEKQCNTCKQVKPLVDFMRHHKSHDGRQLNCRDCQWERNGNPAEKAIERRKRWREENKEAKSAKDREYRLKESTKERRRIRYAGGGAEKQHRNTPKGRALAMWNTMVKGAASRGLPVEITKEWIYEKLLAGNCEVTGIPFVFSVDGHPHTVESKGQRRNPYSPSIDRVDSSQGYTVENCQVVVCIYNFCKGGFTDKAVKEFCKKYSGA